jgi:hypothetical protein
MKKSTKVNETKATKAATKPTKGDTKTTEKKSDLTPNQVKLLKAIKDGKPVNRVQLKHRMGVKGGLTKMLGAATKVDGGAAGKDGLLNRGFVKAEKSGDDRGWLFTITPAGVKAIQ